MKRRSLKRRIGAGLFGGLQSVGDQLQRRQLSQQQFDRSTAATLFKDAADKVAAGTWTPEQAAQITGGPVERFSAMQPSIESQLDTTLGGITKAPSTQQVPTTEALALSEPVRRSPRSTRGTAIPSEPGVNPDTGASLDTLPARHVIGDPRTGATESFSPMLDALTKARDAKLKMFEPVKTETIGPTGSKTTRYDRPLDLAGQSFPTEPEPGVVGQRQGEEVLAKLNTEMAGNAPQLRGQATQQEQLSGELSPQVTAARTAQAHAILMGSQYAPDTMDAKFKQAAGEASARRRAEMQAEMGALGMLPQQMSAAMQLSDDFTKQSAPYTEVEASYRQIKNLTTPNVKHTPQDDLGVIFSFMHMLDPASTVREGEQKLASHTASIPSWIQNAYDRVINRNILGDDERRQFVATAEQVFQGRLTDQQRRIGEFEDRARQYRIPGSLVTRPVGEDLLKPIDKVRNRQPQMNPLQR